MKGALFSLIVASGLAGCRAGAGDYPAAARELLSASFADDGKAHIQQRGAFKIKPDTIFCTYRTAFGLAPLAVREYLITAGQQDANIADSQASGIFGSNPTPECENAASIKPIFARGEQTANRAGQPYRLTLTVWQGSAVWVGVIERADGLRTDSVATNVPVNDGPSILGPSRDELHKRARRRDSAERDVLELSRMFFKHSGAIKSD